MQFFEHNIMDDNTTELINDNKVIKKTNNNNRGNLKMTFEELKTEIASKKAYPSDFFTVKEIIGSLGKDETGNIVFYGGDDKVVGYLNKQLPDINTYTKQISDYEKKIGELEKVNVEFTNIKKELAKNKALGSIDTVLKSRTLDEKQNIWIKKQLEKKLINSDLDENNVENTLNSKIDEEIELYKDFYQLHFPQLAESNQEIKENLTNSNIKETAIPSYSMDGISEGLL
jgi:hypothetical protein